MDDWTPPQEPHQDHPGFKFRFQTRNPVKDGQFQHGKKRSFSQKAQALSPAKAQFEAMCAKFLSLVDDFNTATMNCKTEKKGTAVQQVAKQISARKQYDAAVLALNRFMGKADDDTVWGYGEYLRPFSFNVEVVMSYGFVVGARIFGITKIQPSKSGIGKKIAKSLKIPKNVKIPKSKNSAPVFAHPEVPSSSSSSYYSVY